jgi:hypothetical protein
VLSRLSARVGVDILNAQTVNRVWCDNSNATRQGETQRNVNCAPDRIPM